MRKKFYFFNFNQCFNRKNISTNHDLDKKFASASLSMDVDYDAETRNLLADVNGN
jgi:hypothetical protein